MELMAILAALGRRWYLTLPILLLTMLGLYAVVGTNPSGYKANASVVILSSQKTDNPFLQPGSTNIIPPLLARLGGDDFASQVKANGGGTSWTISDPTGSPVLELTATDATAAASLRTINVVIGQAKQSFNEMQVEAGTTAKNMLTLGVVNAPTRGVPQYGSKIKVALALWVVLIAVSCGIVFGADSLLLRRKRRRQRGAAHQAKFRNVPPLPNDLEASA